MMPIVCFGGLNVDRKLWLHAPLVEGTSNPVQGTQCAGGVARNVADQIVQSGAAAQLMSAVGDDGDGQWLLTDCAAKDIEILHCPKIPAHSTGHYLAVLEQDGGLQAGYADMGIYDALTLSDYRDALSQLPKGSLLFIDCNLPAPLIQDLLRTFGSRLHCCIDGVSTHKIQRLPKDLSTLYCLFCNADEFRALSGTATNGVEALKPAVQHFLNTRKAQQIVLSLGSEGAICGDKESLQHLPVTPIKTLDVTGAGDALCAQTLVGIQHDLPLHEAVALGQMAAARVLQTAHSSLSEPS